jgi:hypothetical protein
MDRMNRSFEDMIQDLTGEGFIKRSSLYQEIERALKTEAGRFILVTGEPGAGKTSLLAGLGKAHTGWLRYFIRRDSRTALTGGDLQSFLLAIGDQFARLRPELFLSENLKIVVNQRVKSVGAGGSVVGIRIEDLTASPFYQTAAKLMLDQKDDNGALTLDQQVDDAAGDVRGIEIGTASPEPRLLEPANLAHLGLIDPAEALLREDPKARIVILLDALDELAGDRATASLLDWVTEGPELPPNVSVVVTSRPHRALGLIRSRREGQLTEVRINPDSPQVADDLLAYARHVLPAGLITAAARDEGLAADEFRREAVSRASGNFLYLSAYARALGDATSREDESLRARLLDLAGFPQGLAGLYRFFAEAVRADLDRFDVAAREAGPAGTKIPAWEGVGRPILGLLTVAREPLAAEDLIALGGIRAWPSEVDGILERMRWLLAERDDRIAFYHSSFGEFLSSEQARRECRGCAVDTPEWHERVVRHYQGGTTWAQVNWDSVGHYGLAHIAEHMTRCRAAVADQVVELACPGLRQAIRAAFGSDRHFMAVIDIAADRVIGHFPVAAALPAVMRLGTARRQMRRSSLNLPPAVLGLLARMGRTWEAVEYVKALPPSRRRFRGACEILQHARERQGDTAGRRELTDLLVESVLGVPGGFDHRKALKQAAQEVAPYDLARALRLWTRAQAGESDSGDAEAPDPVYRAAAAATADADQASALIAPIRVGQATAYLDLAARADPAQVQDLLGIAEDALAGAGHAERLHCLGRLAAAWTPIEPEQARRLLRALEDEATRDGPDKGKHAEGLAQAAAELAVTHPALAGRLLESPAIVEPGGRARSAAFRAAEAWAAHGSPDKAQQLVDRLLARGIDAVFDLAAASKVISAFDAGAGWQLAEGAYARIPIAKPGMGQVGNTRRDGQLKAAATALARHDPRRAVEIAKEIGVTDWEYYQHVEGIVADRDSMLALLAHLQLNIGNSEHAQEILEDLLASREPQPPLADEAPVSPAIFFRQIEDPQQKLRAAQTARLIERGGTASKPVPRSEGLAAFWCSHPTTEDQVRRLNYEIGGGPLSGQKMDAIGEWFNQNSRWVKLRKDRFYRDPADVIRAMSPAPSRAASPYSWARTFRVLAEEVARRDPRRATALVSALSGGERAVGLAALMEESCAGKEDPLHDEFLRQLPEIECYEWTLDSKDDEPFAYIRPDHRARFEAAIRLLPRHAHFGMPPLAESGAYYLAVAYQSVYRAMYSAEYASAVLGRRPQRSPIFREVHKELLRGDFRIREPLLDDVTLAAAVAHEYLVASAGDRPVTGPLPRIDDPLYAAVADLVAPPDGSPRGAAFASRVREMMRGPRLPAIVGLIAYAAELMPSDIGWIRELGEEILAAIPGRPTEDRIAALLPLATSTALPGLVDPLELLNQVRKLDADIWRYPEIDEVLVGLFPTLLARHPAIALRLIYDDLARNWNRAMALLESGAKTIIDALGFGAPMVLHQAIRQGLECASRDGTAPDTVDGVQITQRPMRPHAAGS